MGLLEIASGNSVWRGYDYYEASKVLGFERIDDVTLADIIKSNE